MTDLSINTANVAPNGCLIESGFLSGAAITPGKSVYLDQTVNPANWKLARANSATTSSGLVGIALNNALAAGQPLDVARGGSPNVGANPIGAAGTEYYISAANAGGIAPAADLATGNQMAFLGISDGTNLVMPPNGPWPTGIVHA